MSAFINNPLSSNFLNTYKKCKPVKTVLPSFAPIISNISVNTSVAEQYSMVYINGMNFFSKGITYVNFGSSYTEIPIVYYNSFNISFLVPLDAAADTYNIVVVNVYCGQFSVPINISYEGVLNYSNSVPYIIT